MLLPHLAHQSWRLVGGDGTTTLEREAFGFWEQVSNCVLLLVQTPSSATAALDGARMAPPPWTDGTRKANDRGACVLSGVKPLRRQSPTVHPLGAPVLQTLAHPHTHTHSPVPDCNRLPFCAGVPLPTLFIVKIYISLICASVCTLEHTLRRGHHTNTDTLITGTVSKKARGKHGDLRRLVPPRPPPPINKYRRSFS